MNTAIATRLLWKEYRQQRNLWIALLFGATLLQLIFWFFLEEPRTANETHLLPIHLSMTVMMTFLFPVCSAAISFAIEREEGTHLRLVSLSCPPGLMLGIKFAVGLLGTVLLLIVSATIGASLSVGIGAAINTLYAANSNELLARCYWGAAFVGSSLVIGAFFSLVCRKVLPAVIAAAVVTLVSWPFLFSAWETSYSTLRRPDVIWLMAVIAAGIGVLGLIDFLLVRWWMNRGFSDAPKVRSRSLFRRFRVQRDGLDGSVTLEIGGADRAEFEVLTPDQARVLPPPRLGLSLLYNNWGRGRSRVLRFLCWKEATESRRLFLVFLAVVVALALTPADRVHSGMSGPRRGESLAFLIMIGVLSTFFCGLLAFRGEQSSDSYRLLSDRGVTPGFVWLSKQIVWLSRIVLILGCIFGLVALMSNFRAAASVLWIASGNDYLNGAAPSSWSDFNYLSAAAQLFAMVLVYYSICQMASLLWRRAALSLFFALLCCVLMGMWQGAATIFDVPPIVAVFPMAPALLLLTRLRTRGWLIGDDRFKRLLLPGTFGFLGIAACWLTTATWRIFEIPTAQPIVATKTLDDGSTAETINGLTAAEQTAILAPVSDEETATADLYRKAAETFTLGGSSQVSPNQRELILGIQKPDPPPQIRDDPEMMKVVAEGNRLTLEKSAEAVALCRQAAANEVCASESPATGIYGGNRPFYRNTYVNRLPGLANLTLVYAERERRNGNLSEALAIHRDVFAMARHAGGRGADREFNQWRVITLDALDSLTDWSRSSDVTPELVAEATAILDDHLKKSPDLFAVSFAHHQVVRNTLDLSLSELLELQEGKKFSSDKFFEQYIVLKFPGTLSRIDRLIDWYQVRSAKLIDEALLIEAKGSSARSLGSWYRKKLAIAHLSPQQLTLPEHKRWLRSTPIPGNILDDIGLSLVFVRGQTEMLARGTQIAMRLNLARRENGELPESLDELGLSADVLIEPWSGQQFVWLPKGSPYEARIGETYIPPNTPFLFAGGPQGGYLKQLDEAVRVEGPFDPPAKVIPLDSAGGFSTDDAQAGTDDAALQNPVAALPISGLGLEAEAKSKADDPFGDTGFGGMAGGMGSAPNPNVRWETRRWIVVRFPEPKAGPADVAPTVWLFPPDTASPAEEEGSDK